MTCATFTRIFMMLLLFLEGTSMAADKSWDKVFAKSEQVNVQKVRFKNRYGILKLKNIY